MKKRIALLLALVMILSPLSAFAAPNFTATAVRDVRTDDTGESANITVTFDRNDFKNLPAGTNQFWLRVNLSGARIDTNAGGAVTLNPDRVFTAGDLDPVVLPGAGTNDLSNRTDGEVNSFWISFRTPADIDLPANLDVRPNFTIEMTGLKITASSGDITANMRAYGTTAAQMNASEALFGSALSNISTVTLFTMGEGKVDMWMRDTKHITRGHHWNDIGGIWFQELRINAWQDGGQIRLDLPRGFHWDQDVTEVTLVNHSDNVGIASGTTMRVSYATPTGESTTNYRRAIIHYEPTAAGRMVLDNQMRSQILMEGLRLMADRNTASDGAVVASISTSGSVTAAKSELTIAQYGTEEVTFARVGDVKNVYSGRTQELNDLVIRETMWGTIGTNRTIELTLPEGVKWRYTPDSNYVDPGLAPMLENDVDDLEGLRFRALGGGVTGDGNIAWFYADRSRQRIVATVVYESAPMDRDPRVRDFGGGTRVGAEIVLENLQVAIDSQFQDKDIEVLVEAGAWSETLVLGRAVPAVTAEMEEVAPVQVGFRSQPIGDIVITEFAPGAIRRQTPYADSVITLQLEGVRLASHKFTETPVATVEFAGTDIRDSVQIEKVWMSPDRDRVHIQVEDRGVNAISAIRLSNLELTLDRTAPEGPIEIFIGGGSIIDPATWQEQYFLNSTWLHRFNVAEVITPADRTVVPETVTFVVGQNTYTVGGRTVTMDTAPYNKDGRVMLPARFVANALGITDENVVWDQASQTVSVFVRDWTAQMTVGSNVAHGRQTLMMDVAPENINGRVFVPMRFLANLMGVDNDDITWNQAAQSVTFY